MSGILITVSSDERERIPIDRQLGAFDLSSPKRASRFDSAQAAVTALIKPIDTQRRNELWDQAQVNGRTDDDLYGRLLEEEMTRSRLRP